MLIVTSSLCPHVTIPPHRGSAAVSSSAKKAVFLPQGLPMGIHLIFIPSPSLKSFPPNTATLGIGASTYDFQGVRVSSTIKPRETKGKVLVKSLIAECALPHPHRTALASQQGEPQFSSSLLYFWWVSSIPPEVSYLWINWDFHLFSVNLQKPSVQSGVSQMQERSTGLRGGNFCSKNRSYLSSAWKPFPKQTSSFAISVCIIAFLLLSIPQFLTVRGSFGC